MLTCQQHYNFIILLEIDTAERFGKIIIVIPTISWSTNESFEFCFDGIEEGSVVAISTLGSRKEKQLFLNGYFEMIKRIQPTNVLCYGKPFTEMGNEIIYIDYLNTTGRVK